MNVRGQHAAATRAQMIAAGLRLAELVGLSGMSVNLIVEEAGVAKGTFFYHFGDRSRFLLAIHDEFHERVFADIAASIAGIPPGRQRLLVASGAYLDGCLHNRGIRALLCEARAEPTIVDAIETRNRQAAEFLTPDFVTLGWTHPAAAAALWNTMVVEVALVELRARRRHLASRSALAQFLSAQMTVSASSTHPVVAKQSGARRRGVRADPHPPGRRR